VRATRRTGSIRQNDPRLSGFWTGVDEYECLVDEDLQILMSVTGMVDGFSVATISVERVNVDGPLQAMFDFSPPIGTHIVRVSEKTNTRDQQ
jgi:hypothetical protein